MIEFQRVSEGYLMVEAISANEAEKKARELVENPIARWHRFGPVRVISVKEVGSKEEATQHESKEKVHA